MSAEAITNPANKKPSPDIEDAPVASDAVHSIKGFDADFSCRGFKFEIGKTYEVGGKIKACKNGFHACPVDAHPLSVLEFYPPTSRFAEVVQDRDSDREGSKLASAKITIGVELSIGDLAQRAVKWVFDRANWTFGVVAEGDNEGVTASGTRGAATASGEQGAATASGEQGAATASGYQGAATASGESSVATSTGFFARARANKGSAICLVHRNDDGSIVAIRASKVGENGVKPDVWYSLNALGEFVECE